MNSKRSSTGSRLFSQIKNFGGRTIRRRPSLAAPCSSMTVYRTNDDCDVLCHDNKRNITIYEREYVDDGNALQLQAAGDACIVYRTHANLCLDLAACCIQSVMRWNNSIWLSMQRKIDTRTRRHPSEGTSRIAFNNEQVYRFPADRWIL